MKSIIAAVLLLGFFPVAANFITNALHLIHLFVGVPGATVTPTPTPTPSPAPTATPRPLHGIFAFGQETGPTYNDDVSGWTQVINWKDYEHGSAGSYNFSAFDGDGTTHGYTYAQAHSKQLLVHLNLLSGYPNYVRDDPSIIKYTWHRADGDLIMVLPWDVQTNLINGVVALCVYVDTKAVAIVGGYGYKVETYMPIPSNADCTPLLSDRYTDDTFVTAYKVYATLLTDTFHANLTTTKYLDAGGDLFHKGGTNCPNGGVCVENFVFDYGLAQSNNFGIMQWGLNAISTNSFFVNKYIQDNDANHPGGFQMTGCVTTTGCGGDVKGTLDQALANGVSLGADFIEVYGQDIVNPIYFPLFHTIDQQLRNKVN